MNINGMNIKIFEDEEINSLMTLISVEQSKLAVDDKDHSTKIENYETLKQKIKHL